jgi:hypothetical protein
VSGPITAGDMVMIVRATCVHDAKWLGKVFTIPRVAFDFSYCSACGAKNVAQPHAVLDDGLYEGVPISHLMRIDPPAKTRTTDAPEELTA